MTFFEDKKIPSSLKIPTFLKVVVKLIYFISKNLCISIASRLFIRPIRFKRPDRELPMLETSQHKKLKVSSIKKEIHILSYGFSDKKVLLAHGWAGRDTQLFMIANKLLEKGFMVISFDAPAHGKSTGKTTELLDYIETIKEINREFGPFCAAVGHSFGGMAILNTQSQKPIFNCLVTIGSGDKTSTILNNFASNLGLPKSFGVQLKNHFNKKWKINVDDYASSNASKKIDKPVLIVHDVLDGDVDVSCAINIRHNLKKGNLLITKGLGHTKILRDKEVTEKIVTFIKVNT